MTPTAAVSAIFETTPTVHFLKIEPGYKCPKKGSLWRNRPLSEDDAIKWLEAGHRLGIVPGSARAVVVDIDQGGQQSLDLAKAEAGDPIAIIETGSHTADNPRWHLIYAKAPDAHVGNAKWVGGDIRGDEGYVVAWDLGKWAEAAGRIAIQAIPPAPVSKLATAQPTANGSPIIGFQVEEGLHPRALEEIGRAIRESNDWGECVAKCKTIVEAHIERRKARDGDNARTEEKLKSEIQAWNKAIPKWWKEKTDMAAGAESGDGDGKRIRIDATSDNPAVSMVEALTKMGYVFRTMLYGMRPSVKRKDEDESKWRALSDGEHAELMIEVGERCYWEVLRKKEIYHKPISIAAPKEKQAIRALSHRDIYDPIREWFDALPKWDASSHPSRIFEFMADSGLTLETSQEIAKNRHVDISDWANSYFFVEMIRLTYFPGAQRFPMPVFRGRGGEGKSSIGKMALPKKWRKPLFSDKYRLSLDDQKRAMICIKNKVLEVPEFGVHRKADWDEIKSAVFEDNAEARLPYGEHITEVPRHDVMYVTTNKSNLPEDDEAIHRRFIYVNLKGKAKRLNKVAYYHLDEIIDGHTLRDWLFAEAKHWVFADAEPENFCLLPDLEPEEWMTFNKMQGGTFQTAGVSFKMAVSDLIDELIKDETQWMSQSEMRMAVALMQSGKDYCAEPDMDDRMAAKNISAAQIENAVRTDAVQRRDWCYKSGRKDGAGGGGPRGYNRRKVER